MRGDGTITVEDAGSLELPRSAAIEKEGDVTGVEKKILKLCSICLEKRPESEYSRSQIKRGPRRVCKICIQTNRTRPVSYTPNAKTANNSAISKDDKPGNIDADANAGNARSGEENKDKDNSKEQKVTFPSPSTMPTTTSVNVQIPLEN